MGPPHFYSDEGLAHHDGLNDLGSSKFDHDYAGHSPEQYSDYASMSTGVGVTSDMRLTAFANQPASTPGCHGFPGAATADAPQASRCFPGKRAAPPPDRAQ